MALLAPNFCENRCVRPGPPFGAVFGNLRIQKGRMPMVVTIVCDVLGDENNGTSMAAMHLIGYLESKGHEVRIICPDADKKGKPGYFIVPAMNFYLFNGYVKKNGVNLAKPDREVIRAAVDGADVVHVMMPFFLGHHAAKYAMEQGVAVTASFHCQAENLTNHFFLMNIPAANKLAYKAFYQSVYRYCGAIHYPTQFICDTFEKHVGPTNHYIISNGVDQKFGYMPGVEKPGPYKDKIVILFTGRYSREKSHKVLINGAARSKYKDKIQLILAGSGPQRENLIRHARKKLPIPPVFRFFSHKELVEVINYADLYVHPAEIEIEAISCVEAIFCGKTPIISNSKRSATRHFALSEKNLFECNNAADLAAKIDYWIEHPHEREECSRQYIDFAKQFSFDSCMEKLEQMLLDMAKEKQGG